MSRNLRGLSCRQGLSDSLYDRIAGAASDGSVEEKLRAVAGEFMTGEALRELEVSGLQSTFS